jgi:glutathione S-transferase
MFRKKPDAALSKKSRIRTMKLYYAPGACSLAIHIVLEWIGAPYESQSVKPGSPEILKVNPSGAVPALDTGEGWTLTQAAAVLRHLARVHPKARLAGGGGLREQAELDRWLCFLTGDMHPAFFPVFMPQRYTTATDDAALKAVREAGLALVRKRFSIMEAHLQGRTFFLGDARSILDAYAFPMVRWGAATLPGGLADFPAIRAQHDSMARDEGVRRALAAEGIA